MDTMELRNTLLQAFSEEAPELLQRAEKAFFDLESASVAEQQGSCEALKRALHSLKGSASAIGSHNIRDVCHAMEDLVLFIVQHGKTPQRLDVLHHGLRHLQEAARSPAEHLDASEVLALLTNPDNLAAVPEHTMVVEQITTVTQTDSVSVEMDTFIQTDAVMKNDAVTKTDSMLETAVAAPLVASATDSAPALTETIRVAVNKIENMQSAVGELVAIRLQQDDSLVKLNELQLNIGDLSSLWRTLTNELREVRQNIPASAASKLDSKVSGFSAHVKQVERHLFHLSHQMGSQTGQLSLLCDAMDSGLRAIRMMPLGPFLESYRSAARDAARALGKSVLLECEDKGIEIDRLVLEHIKEPLLHLVRNAVSHGIESPALRVSEGKPETGSIRISAQLSGDYVSIAIMDDGAGFNRQKIFRKALALGILRSEDELTDEKMIEVVCRPGFSTSTATDLVSGRGIGMDVVSTMVAELGGSVGLETYEGGGTCITLRVPSSLATTQGLILQVGSERYGVVLDMVERIVRSRLDDLSTVEGKEVLYLDDNPIAVTSLATVLELSSCAPQNNRNAYPIVILRAGSMRLAMIVDDIPGEIPMIVKPLGPQFENVPVYSGGAILSDGSVMPVLEARHVINMVSSHAALRLERSSATESDVDGGDHDALQDQGQCSILVVDDSITTRTLERNILEAAGYRVLVATDGMEAADILRIEDSVALVVTDLEMPRMNGLELCRHIRSGRHARLPIIMVTSVGSETEKQKGLTAGADAYIVKGNFQQDHFLATVRRFVDVG